jgi:hypothetical protein
LQKVLKRHPAATQTKFLGINLLLEGGAVLGMVVSVAALMVEPDVVMEL